MKPDAHRFADAPTHRLIARFHACIASDLQPPADLIFELDVRGIDIMALEDTPEYRRAADLNAEMAEDIGRFTEIETIRRQERLPAGIVTTFHMRHLREIAASPAQFEF